MPDEVVLLRRIDAYLDAAPRTGSRVEVIGPFTLFVNQGHGWRYYARPTPGHGPCTADDIGVVRRRQRELAQPEALEWIEDLSPEIGAAAADEGLYVVRHPLMVLRDMLEASPTPDGVEVSIADADDDLAMLSAVAEVGFAAPGTGVGDAGAAEAAVAARKLDPETIAFQRSRMLTGLTVAAAARVAGVVAAVGWHQPLDGASEIVGVATLPSMRRRGLGVAVTGALVADALDRGVETVFLSADDEAVARIYERVGFRRIGTAAAASVQRPRAGPT